jgi:hypothetical protein
MLHHKDGSEPKLQEDDDTMDVADQFIRVEKFNSISISSKLGAVTKLIDAYLSEIAKDPGLPLEKFIALAESLPPASRPVHDALYRAIDVYLKVCIMLLCNYAHNMLLHFSVGKMFRCCMVCKCRSTQGCRRARRSGYAH